MKLSRNKRLLFAGIMALMTMIFFAFQDKSFAIAGYINVVDSYQGSGCVNTSCPVAAYRLFAPNAGIDWHWNKLCSYDMRTNFLLPNGSGPVSCVDNYNGGCCNNIDAASKCTLPGPVCPPTGTPPPPPTPILP